MSSPGALFLQAAWIGLSIAAPVGPIGLLVIQRSLRHGAALGLATGLGAAAADAIYGAVGAYGVSALIGLLQGLRVPLALFGGCFLLWMAWRTWRSEPPAEAARQPAAPTLPAAFAGTLLLTLSNPSTILSFVAIFGALLGKGPAARAGSPALMVAGVFVGSALWWLLLSRAVSALRSRFGPRQQRAVNRASALLLAGFASATGWTLWQAR